MENTNSRPTTSNPEISRRAFLGSALMATAGCAYAPKFVSGSPRWYKGMLHCHSYWSDGRAFPEQAISAYRELGYDFMSLTDHNRLSMTRDEWRPVRDKEGGWPPKTIPLYFENLKRRFPWTKFRRNAQGETEVRLTPYAELLRHFSEPGRFLLIPGTEVTRGTGDWTTGRQLHMNAIGLDEVIPSARYSRLVQDVFRDHTVSTLIRATREETEILAAAKGNPPHLFTVDHPHWPYYDVLPQDLIDNPEVQFFEVCNNGAEKDAISELQKCGGYDIDRFWDVVNAFRARAGQPLLYATAVDDAHWYPFSGATPRETCESGFAGDGYIRVRADALTPSALFAAMEKGDFYASCGLDLDDVAFDGRTLRVRVPALPGVACRVQFIVTKRDFDDRIVRTVKLEKTETNRFERTIPLHSETIGRVVREVAGERGMAIEASYTLAADDLYARARVVSDRLSPWATWRRALTPHPVHPKCATAWTQPYQS